MRTSVGAGVTVSFDKATQKLSVSDQWESESGETVQRQILEFHLSERKGVDLRVLEETLGQLILYSLDRQTPGGLGVGNYSEVLEKISEDNVEIFAHGVHLANPDDQYDLATVLFSRGRRFKSWETVERAILLFEQAAASGNQDAIRFLAEQLPVVRAYIEEKLKRSE